MSLDDLEAEEYLTLRRFHGGPKGYARVPAEERLRGVFIDCETTGLDPEVDKIIQLAIVPFTFSKEGVVCGSEVPIVFHEDPGAPLTEVIVKLTGLTDDELRGKRFPEARILDLLEGVAFVVCHNAEFDRQFLEKRFPTFETMRFGCSKTDVPWADAGYTSDKLEWLAFKHLGVFFDAHDAATDAEVGITLLASEVLGRPGMSYVLDAARHSYDRIYASLAPYETRHILKARGYRWNNGEDGMPKAWYIDKRVPDESVEEKAWLAKNAQCPKGYVYRFDARQRFSARIGR